MAERDAHHADPARIPSQLAEIKPATTFARAVRILNHLPNLETGRPGRDAAETFKLNRMRAMLERLGDPHDALTLVHIAGSKGKGSIAEMCTAALTGCGYATGILTSPHLVDVRERIRIGDRMIPEADFVRVFNRCLQAASAVQPEMGPASYFEMTTAMAFAYFHDAAVDAAVIEVGLGGRLDATNVITPAVSIIGAIQLEHTEILGATPAEIAREKAGILKPGVPALTIKQGDAEALAAIEGVAASENAPLSVLGRDIDYTQRFEADHELGPHMRVGIGGDRAAFEHIAVPLPGEHQAQNCGLALAAIDALIGVGFDAPEIRVAEGLAQTRRSGRLETIWQRPRVVIDGAHSPDSIASLVKTIGAHIHYDSMVVVFGCASDKDIDAMLTGIGRGADKIIMTRAARNPRSCDPAILAERYEELCGKTAQVELSVKDALNTAAQAVRQDDLICVTGSFYIAGEAKRLFNDKAAHTVTA
ncbi:MAG: folylpolyglutamate synthase/dihydrofolate synthase family protein [Planctomycetota bacterium]